MGKSYYPAEFLEFGDGGVTHLVMGGLSVEDDGTVTPCTWGNDTNTKRAHQYARGNGTKVQLMLTMNEAWMTNQTMRVNFMDSLKAALDACDAQGFEVDWEGPGTQEVSDNFLRWLIDARKKLGSSKYALSFDTEPPQWIPGDYFKPNASIFREYDDFEKENTHTGGNYNERRAEIFINFMTYFATGDGDSYLGPYKTAIETVLTTPIVQYPKSTVNIAIPYYEQSQGQNQWAIICSTCKDLPPNNNTCGWRGPDIVGKKANYDIGRLIKENGLGGVFPWSLDYDVAPSDTKTCGDNSLFKWLSKALKEPV